MISFTRPSPSSALLEPFGRILRSCTTSEDWGLDAMGDDGCRLLGEGMDASWYSGEGRVSFLQIGSTPSDGQASCFRFSVFNFRWAGERSICAAGVGGLGLAARALAPGAGWLLGREATGEVGVPGPGERGLGADFSEGSRLGHRLMSSDFTPSDVAVGEGTATSIGLPTMEELVTTSPEGLGDLVKLSSSSAVAGFLLLSFLFGGGAGLSTDGVTVGVLHRLDLVLGLLGALGLDGVFGGGESSPPRLAPSKADSTMSYTTPLFNATQHWVPLGSLVLISIPGSRIMHVGRLRTSVMMASFRRGNPVFVIVVKGPCWGRVSTPLLTASLAVRLSRTSNSGDILAECEGRSGRGLSICAVGRSSICATTSSMRLQTVALLRTAQLEAWRRQGRRLLLAIACVRCERCGSTGAPRLVPTTTRPAAPRGLLPGSLRAQPAAHSGRLAQRSRNMGPGKGTRPGEGQAALLLRFRASKACARPSTAHRLVPSALLRAQPRVEVDRSSGWASLKRGALDVGCLAANQGAQCRSGTHGLPGRPQHPVPSRALPCSAVASMQGWGQGIGAHAAEVRQQLLRQQATSLTARAIRSEPPHRWPGTLAASPRYHLAALMCWQAPWGRHSKHAAVAARSCKARPCGGGSIRGPADRVCGAIAQGPGHGGRGSGQGQAIGTSGIPGRRPARGRGGTQGARATFITGSWRPSSTLSNRRVTVRTGPHTGPQIVTMLCGDGVPG